MATSTDLIRELANREYAYGFVTEIESEGRVIFPQMPHRRRSSFPSSCFMPSPNAPPAARVAADE